MEETFFSRGKFVSGHPTITSWEEALERCLWLRDFGEEDGEPASVIRSKGWFVSEYWTVSAGEPLPRYRRYKDDGKEDKEEKRKGRREKNGRG